MRENEFRVPLYESSCGGICNDFRDYPTTTPNNLKIFQKDLLISFLLYPPGPSSAPLSYNVRRKFVLIRKRANHVMIYVNRISCNRRSQKEEHASGLRSDNLFRYIWPNKENVTLTLNYTTRNITLNHLINRPEHCWSSPWFR